MTLAPAQANHPRRLIQDRLLWLAAGFLFFFSLVLTLAPAVRLHSSSASLNWMHWSGFAGWLAGFLLIHREMGRRFPEADPYILPVVALLSGWGLLTIWRLDSRLGERQTLWLIAAVALLLAGLRRPNFLEWLRRYKYIWLISGLGITALTLIFGTYPGGIGPRLWLGCCGVYFQPSEPLKLLLIIYLAAYLADRLPTSYSLIGLLSPTLVLIGAAAVLLLAQRDLGTVTLLLAIYTLTLYLASGRRRMLLLSLAVILAAAFAGYQLFSVVQVRILAWLNPWADPSGNAYQIVQSILSFSAGGVFGRGPGLGSPGVVPVAHSDFIFSAIGEETGLIGVFAVLLSYFILIFRGFKIAILAPLRYQRYLAAGISAYFAAQTILIIGGNLRLLPLTGVTLPFMSYGGSSLATTFAAVLILLGCCSEPEEEPVPLLRPQAYRLIGGVVALGIISLTLLAGWWALARAADLNNRADNPRRYIIERYVPRGAMLDRNNQVVVYTAGSPGSYTRVYPFPQLSHVTGYNSPLYGQSGLEAGLDEYLRGLKATPASQVWWYSILYGQTPPGLDVRLSLDLGIQSTADRLIAGHHGAAVLLNAHTGEILAMTSHPFYDTNSISGATDTEEINQIIRQLTADKNAPLLNRAAQGQYMPGPALGPFILALAYDRTNLPDLPYGLSFHSPGLPALDCSLPVETTSNLSWGEAIRQGCPGPIASLSKQYTAAQLDDLFDHLGFYKAPVLPIPSAPESTPSHAIERVDLAAIGMENLSVSPLQMALAASALSANGQIPQPILAMAVQTPNQGWVVLPSSQPAQALTSASATAAANSLAQPGEFFWQTLANINLEGGPVTWYLAGTLPHWQGTPLTVAVILEENNPSLAESIGQELLRSTLK